MRAVLAALVVALLFASCGGLSSVPSTADQKRVVQLKCASGGWGTAFPVAREGRFTVLATAKHVVDDECNPEIGVVWKMHDTADVALVITEKRFVPFRLADPVFGENATAYGYPGDPGEGTLHVTRGIIAGETDGIIRITAPLWFGFSGGPVFNDSDEVTCLNTAGYMMLDGWSLCTPAKYIRELLE